MSCTGSTENETSFTSAGNWFCNSDMCADIVGQRDAQVVKMKSAIQGWPSSWASVAELAILIDQLEGWGGIEDRAVGRRAGRPDRAGPGRRSAWRRWPRIGAVGRQGFHGDDADHARDRDDPEDDGDDFLGLAHNRAIADRRRRGGRRSALEIMNIIAPKARLTPIQIDHDGRRRLAGLLR